MKNYSFPSILTGVIVSGYVASIIGAILIDSVYLFYSLIGIGLYFSPVALISLIIYRLVTEHYDQKSFKRALILVIATMVLAGIVMLLINNSFNIGL